MALTRADQSVVHWVDLTVQMRADLRVVRWADQSAMRSVGLMELMRVDH